MKPPRLRASVLPTVTVVCVLLLLIVLGIIWIWESDRLLFNRNDYLCRQRAHIESGFVLYGNYPQIMETLDADSTLQLYDSLPSSRVKLSHRLWGLYEVVIVEADARQRSVRIFGQRTVPEAPTFTYRNGNGTLTLTGNSNLLGRVRLPRGGAVYGQMQSVFFSGQQIAPANISPAPDSLPGDRGRLVGLLDSLRRLPTTDVLDRDSVHVPFHGRQSSVFDIGTGMVAHCSLRGNVVLRGDEIRFDSTCRAQNIVVAGRKVVIGSGFEGSMQVFSSDTIIIEPRVSLHQPSGLCICGRGAAAYIETGSHSLVEGYVIVAAQGEPEIMHPNYRQARTTRLRGLLWVNGITQFQGIVSGQVFIGEAVYYSPQGYYRNLIYDASVLPNDLSAYPLWPEAGQRRKEGAYLHTEIFR